MSKIFNLLKFVKTSQEFDEVDELYINDDDYTSSEGYENLDINGFEDQDAISADEKVNLVLDKFFTYSGPVVGDAPKSGAINSPGSIKEFIKSQMLSKAGKEITRHSNIYTEDILKSTVDYIYNEIDKSVRQQMKMSGNLDAVIDFFDESPGIVVNNIRVGYYDDLIKKINGNQFKHILSIVYNNKIKLDQSDKLNDLNNGEIANSEKQVSSLLSSILENDSERSLLLSKVQSLFGATVDAEILDEKINNAFLQVVSSLSKKMSDKEPSTNIETNQMVSEAIGGDKLAREKIMDYWAQKSKKSESSKSRAGGQQLEMDGRGVTGLDYLETARMVEEQDREKIINFISSRISIQLWLEELVVQKKHVFNIFETAIRKMANNDKSIMGMPLDTYVYVDLYLKYYFRILEYVYNSLQENITTKSIDIDNKTYLRGASSPFLDVYHLMWKDILDITVGDDSAAAFIRSLSIPKDSLLEVENNVRDVLQSAEKELSEIEGVSGLSVDEILSKNFINKVIDSSKNKIRGNLEIGDKFISNIIPQMRRNKDIVNTREFISEASQYDNLLDKLTDSDSFDMEENSKRVEDIINSIRKSKNQSLFALWRHIDQLLLKLSDEDLAVIDDLARKRLDIPFPEDGKDTEAYAKGVQRYRRLFLFRLIKHYGQANRLRHGITAFKEACSKLIVINDQLSTRDDLDPVEYEDLIAERSRIIQSQQLMLSMFSSRKKEAREFFSDVLSDAEFDFGEHGNLSLLSHVSQSVGSLDDNIFIRDGSVYAEVFKGIIEGQKRATEVKRNAEDESAKNAILYLSSDYEINSNDVDYLEENFKKIYTNFNTLFQTGPAKTDFISKSPMGRVLNPFVEQISDLRKSLISMSRNAGFSASSKQIDGDLHRLSNSFSASDQLVAENYINAYKELNDAGYLESKYEEGQPSDGIIIDLVKMQSDSYFDLYRTSKFINDRVLSKMVDSESLSEDDQRDVGYLKTKNMSMFLQFIFDSYPKFIKSYYDKTMDTIVKTKPESYGEYQKVMSSDCATSIRNNVVKWSQKLKLSSDNANSLLSVSLEKTNFKDVNVSPILDEEIKSRKDILMERKSGKPVYYTNKIDPVYNEWGGDPSWTLLGLAGESGKYEPAISTRFFGGLVTSYLWVFASALNGAGQNVGLMRRIDRIKASLSRMGMTDDEIESRLENILSDYFVPIGPHRGASRTKKSSSTLIDQKWIRRYEAARKFSPKLARIIFRDRIIKS